MHDTRRRPGLDRSEDERLGLNFRSPFTRLFSPQELEAAGIRPPGKSDTDLIQPEATAIGFEAANPAKFADLRRLQESIAPPPGFERALNLPIMQNPETGEQRYTVPGILPETLSHVLNLAATGIDPIGMLAISGFGGGVTAPARRALPRGLGLGLKKERRLLDRLIDKPSEELMATQFTVGAGRGRGAGAVSLGLQRGADIDELGFFSGMRRAAEAISQETMTSQQAYKMLLSGGAKPEEIKWTGTDEFLAGRDKVTREELLAHIDDNVVDVQEVTLAGEHAKFAEWQLPGGEKYREVVLTMPIRGTIDGKNIGEWNKISETLLGEGAGNSNSPRHAEWLQAIKNRDELTETRGQAFTGGHYGDVAPNALAHVRMNDRTGPNGERILHIEEIQSDWAQKARGSGFADPEQALSAAEAKEMDNLIRRVHMPGGPPGGDLSVAENARMGALHARNERALSGVPRGPFVGSTDKWTSLALKRLIRKAVDEGYDRVTITSGQIQADRYDLSKQIDELIVERSGDRFEISATMPHGGGTNKMGSFGADELDNVVGKDLAATIRKQGDGGEVYDGQDLKVGGEGMKYFYDNIIPKNLQKVVKKLGGPDAEVGTSRLDTGRATVQRVPAENINRAIERAQAAGDHPTAELLRRAREGLEQGVRPRNAYSVLTREELAEYLPEAVSSGGMTEVWSIDITPRMRKAAKEGQAKFSGGSRTLGLGSLGLQQDLGLGEQRD